ncbi:MAG: glucokinase [Hydrogenophilales bacterium 16-64-46]|nr:MAG: glucokinase [Hydrogenophilales bacterium 12-64-13]OYZ05087.1 MAG: glucokinase [Hydrogenophilales bacterium 16-64-46]OZA37905.1 MAG: glucokinase [Hydrogenophilales bacterium 17-64-34]HQT00567.1 glucokinase [Thiobacillus sp.]
MELIAGDIGGTKSWLVWMRDGAVTPRFEKVYSSADFASGEALLARFIEEAGQSAHPDTLTLALPGPLAARRVSLTNLDWTLDADALGSALDLPRVQFVNDFQAQAAGVATLGADDVLTLNAAPAVPSGVRAITGAGTGLGLAFMTAGDDGQYLSHATEAGHADFAPANALQGRLLDHLRQRYGHVSWERVVSGSAFNDLYRFGCLEAGRPQPDVPIDGATLTDRASAGDAVAAATLDLFVDLYGAWVGNVALLYQPFGGLYIGGGVATHLVARLRAPQFMRAALDKGRMRGVVERTPIHLITCARLGVQGAVALARAQPDSYAFNSNTAVTRSGT